VWCDAASILLTRVEVGAGAGGNWETDGLVWEAFESLRYSPPTPDIYRSTIRLRLPRACTTLGTSVHISGVTCLGGHRATRRLSSSFDLLPLSGL
jgi:hypothetical protein